MFEICLPFSAVILAAGACGVIGPDVTERAHGATFLPTTFKQAPRTWTPLAHTCVKLSFSFFSLSDMGAMLSLFTFLIPSHKLIPIIHFGPKIAHVTVRRRDSPAVLPTDDDHISLNKRSAPDPRSDELKKPSEKWMSLKELVEERVPSLHRPFRPSWWLPNGHFQTGYTVVANFDSVDHVTYKRCVSRISLEPRHTPAHFVTPTFKDFASCSGRRHYVKYCS